MIQDSGSYLQNKRKWRQGRNKELKRKGKEGEGRVEVRL